VKELIKEYKSYLLEKKLALKPGNILLAFLVIRIFRKNHLSLESKFRKLSGAFYAERTR